MTAKQVARFAMLTALALALSFAERFFLLAPGLPGIKLGLANTVLLYGLFLLEERSVWLLMLAKVLLSGLMFGGPSAMLYSLSGGVLSLLVMGLLRRAGGATVISVSVAGAVAHNLGQLMMAGLVVQSRAVLAYLPLLLIAGAVTGALTGVAAQSVVRGLRSVPGRD